jgi:4-amino-4-deoxy-L-arabinose transferase-like glycosyltransferase
MSSVLTRTALGSGTARNVYFWAGLFLFLLLLKLCHLHILWAEEGYGSAAAVQILHGKMLYRDFWFDKPPLAALVFALWHGRAGLGLRLADAVYAWACAVAAYRLARQLWSEREGLIAACLMAFFLVFDLPAAITTLAPDLLLILPALAAIDCAARRMPFWAGVWCAIGLAVNAKGILVLAVCLVWLWPSLIPLAVGFLAASAPWLVWLAANHALPDYWLQVWWFGAQYSRDTFVVHPWIEGLTRTLHWTGFHAAVIIAAVVCFARRKLWKSAAWLIWIAAGIVGIVAGERFFERYYFLLLPPVVVLAAGGITLVARRWRALILLLLAIPLVRFGPRYAVLARDLIMGHATQWSDVLLNDDSKQAAQLIRSRAQPGDTLLVWGYRPDIFAYAQLPVAGRFLDSQLLTGVIADRHLTSTQVSFPSLAAANRQQLTMLRPTWIVDGLGPMNSSLAITAYPDLRQWFSSNYVQCGSTQNSVIYCLHQRAAVFGSPPSYRSSPASIRIGSTFSLSGSGQVANGVNVQGGL